MNQYPGMLHQQPQQQQFLHQQQQQQPVQSFNVAPVVPEKPDRMFYF